MVIFIKHLKVMRFKKREKLTGTKVLTGCPVLLVTLKLFDWTAQTALTCDITSNYTEINMFLWLYAYAGGFFSLHLHRLLFH